MMRTRRTTPRRRTRSEEEEIKEMEQMQEARSAREMQEEAGKTQAPCSRSRCRSDVCRAWAFSAEFCSARCARYDCMAYPTAPTSTVSMMATVSIDMVSESAAFVCIPRLGCDASPPAACPPACAAAPPKSRPRCARSPTSILILLRSPMLIPAVFSASIVSCASGPPPRRRRSTAVRRPRPSSNCPAAPVASPGCRRTDSSASLTGAAPQMSWAVRATSATATAVQLQLGRSSSCGFLFSSVSFCFSAAAGDAAVAGPGHDESISAATLTSSMPRRASRPSTPRASRPSTPRAASARWESWWE